jgi:holo-[acyl-carrier-protein] synthase
VAQPAEKQMRLTTGSPIMMCLRIKFFIASNSWNKFPWPLSLPCSLYKELAFVNGIRHKIVYCLQHDKPAPFLAARFAAQEAISKAFGTGIGAELGWQDMEIRRKESGEPYVVLHGKGRELFSARGGKSLHVSLTHTENYAAAIAILEG